MKKFRFGVKGMSCAACVAHVEHAAAKVCGRENVSVSLLTASLSVRCDDSVSEDKLYKELKRVLSSAGYGLEKENTESSVRAQQDFRHGLYRLILSCALTLLLMVIAMGHMIGIPLPALLTENGVLFGGVQLLLTLAVILLNFRFFRNGFFALFHGSPNMDSLIAIGSCASFLYGVAAVILMGVGQATANHELTHRYLHNLYFESAAMILTLVSLGKTLEGRAKSGAARAIGELSSMMPDTAQVERNGSVSEIPLSQLTVGDTILVREGEIIPADGEVLDGVGSVDESAISGESIPVEKGQGDKVTAACTLQGGYLRIRALRVGENTTLSRMIGLLEDAAASKAPIARLADRVSGVFVPIVMGISALTFLLWLLLARDFSRALESAISVLVISCPCALGLATPVAITVGISRGASRGILIKSSEALERLHSVDYLLTDKTGTLTEGSPSVTDLLPWGVCENELLLAAYGVEALSIHPLALAICGEAEQRGLSCPASLDPLSVIGAGLGATVDGARCLVGKPEFLRNGGIEIPNTALTEAETLQSEGKTVVFVSRDNAYLGMIAVSDKLRPHSKDALAALKSLGITPIMLTGDNERTAAAIAATCEIDYFARLLPEDKEKKVRSLSENASCAMVGDGINDAPALASADVGIAIGAGTEVAIDCAQVVLAKNSLADAVAAVQLSRATVRCIRQNLFWALLYNSICIPVAAGALYPAFGIVLSPMIASAAMSVSSLFVVFNSLRLRRVRLFGDPIKKKVKRAKKPDKNKKTRKESDLMFGKTKTVSFSVEGMMCKNCKAHVENALKGVKGVRTAVADLETKTVTVSVSEKVTEATLKDAVTAAGYKTL